MKENDKRGKNDKEEVSNIIPGKGANQKPRRAWAHREREREVERGREGSKERSRERSRERDTHTHTPTHTHTHTPTPTHRRTHLWNVIGNGVHKVEALVNPRALERRFLQERHGLPEVHVALNLSRGLVAQPAKGLALFNLICRRLHHWKRRRMQGTRGRDGSHSSANMCDFHTHAQCFSLSVSLPRIFPPPLSAPLCFHP